MILGRPTFLFPSAGLPPHCYHTIIVPVLSPAPVHRISLSPNRSSLYLSISRAICAAFPTVYIVRTFQHPTRILDFGVANDLVGLWASRRLSPIDVMVCPVVPPSTATASPLLISTREIAVSVIFCFFPGASDWPTAQPP